MHRTTLALTAAALMMMVGAASASAAGQPETMNPAGKVRGVVPPHNQVAKGGGGVSNLINHGGRVMTANTAVPIFWSPPVYANSFSPGYQSVINGYFANVAAVDDSSNVYFSDTQYLGTTSTASAKGTSIVDTNPFPPNGCRDRYTAVCLSDAQLQAEIKKIVPSSDIDGNHIFFVFTPKNVGSCYGSSCAYSSFCAYHSQDATGKLIYANQPYAAFVPSACGSGQRPNNDDADATLNVASHEHNEAITDPLGNAWYDSSGNENGDKCAWNFGAATGTPGAEYNQTINGAHYYLQQEWSNHSSGCVLQGV